MTPRRVLFAIEVAVPVTLVAAWWAASARSTSFYFPPLETILAAFKQQWLFQRFGSDVLPSLGRLLAGFSIAVVLGVTLGTIIGLQRVVRHLLSPLIEFMRAIPPVALISVAILFFGVGDEMKIFFIALGCVFPVLLNTTDGVASVNQTLLDTAYTYRIRGWRRIRTVILPAALPKTFAGIRTSLAIGLILMVISEMVASSNGLGYFIIDAQRSFAIPEMWAGILLIGALGYLLNLVLGLFERRILRWHRQSQAGSEQ